MRRLLKKTTLFFQPLSKLAGVFLAIALGIGAHAAALEAFYFSPVLSFSSYLEGFEPAIEETCTSEYAILDEAERNLPFDSGASTSSDRQSDGVRDLVRFLSHRPVIIDSPGGLLCLMFRQ